MSREIPVTFNNGEEQLFGIIHQPENIAEIDQTKTGVVFVVGGPQYRIGSHRQFIKLSRFLADKGFSSIRFDCAGMGDSSGEFKSFLHISNDIRCAADALIHNSPHIDKIILWGLCDAATAATQYSNSDERVKGLFLLNPWVKDEQLAAEALVKNHYKKQILSLDFWKRVLTGKVKLFAAVTSFLQNLIAMKQSSKQPQDPGSQSNKPQNSEPKSLQGIMHKGLTEFNGATSIILSEKDLTAQEFTTATNSKDWQKLIADKHIPITTIKDANHTFAAEKWRSQVQQLTLDFLLSI